VVRVHGAVHAGGAERAQGDWHEHGHHRVPDVRHTSDGEGRGGTIPGRDRETTDSEQASPAGEAEYHACGAARRAHDRAPETARGARETRRDPGAGQ